MTADVVFKAMADGTRRRILQVLVTTELGVSELVEVLQLPQSTVSRHLKVLRQAGLVDARHAGTSALYFPVQGQNGELTGLNDQMIGWAGGQELSAPLRSRLGQVLRTRRGESDAYFARVAHRWDQMRIECFGPAFHLEAATALLPREWTVADVGTGTGYLLPVLARTFARVIAVDPVAEMLGAARQRVADSGFANVEFRTGTATDLPVEDAELDLCIASLVLHHEPTPTEALAEFRRALKPGGTVLIVEQRAHQLREFHELMQDRWWGFEPEELADQLTQAGFIDTAARPLATAEPTSASAPEAPELFVLTGYRANGT